MVEELPHIPDIERLSPRVIRILGGNPSKFTLQGTNTHLIGTGPKRILLDTAEGKPIWKESLAAVLRSEHASLSAVILTHWHADHVGGIAQVRSLQPGVEILKNDPAAGQTGFEDGQVFRVEGASLRAVHSPGHTADHMSFVLAEENAMFTGDNVLGHGTAVFEDLAAYMDSLERMHSQFRGRAYPSHGAVIADGNAKIREYIAHRKVRETEALELLGKKKSPGGGDEWWGSMEMVRVIYAKYPEQYWAPAEGSLKQVLKKLEADGKVRQRSEDGKWALVEKAAL